jgi:hypothetical protein
MMLLYVPGMVAALSVSCADADMVVSAWEVAVTVTLVGRPVATRGAVYTPFASMVPPFGVVTDQVTPVLLTFVTVAVNCAVWLGHPGLLGYTLDGTPGLTVTTVPTVSVSVGVAFVSVPSVPEMVKLNVPAVALPSVTVNGAPAADATCVGGMITHVPGTTCGATAIQLIVTPLRYPFNAVNVPFHVTS